MFSRYFENEMEKHEGLLPRGIKETPSWEIWSWIR